MKESTGSMRAGSPWPFGVQWVEAEDAFNFSLYSRHATGVVLLCYTEQDPARPVFEFRFQHPAHKTGNVWHCRIPATRTSRRHALRVPGRRAARAGARAPLRSGRRSCSIRTRRRCSSRRIQPRRVRATRGRPMAARRSAACRKREPPPFRPGQRPASHLPGRDRL